MRGWALHHIHLVIFIDALLHLVMTGLVAAAWVLFIKFVKLTSSVPKIERRIVLSIMAACMCCMTWFNLQVLFDCLRQYATWWNR